MTALISVRRGGRNNMSCLLYIPAESSVIGDTESMNYILYWDTPSMLAQLIRSIFSNAAILFDPLGFSLGYRVERHVDEV